MSIRTKLAQWIAPREEKRSITQSGIIASTGGRDRWAPKDYGTLARDAYALNGETFTAINLISNAIKQIPPIVRKASTMSPIKGHPAIKLLKRPNPQQGWEEFIEACASYLLITGNCYIECVMGLGQPVELYSHRPDRIKVIPGDTQYGTVSGFRYSLGGAKDILISAKVAPGVTNVMTQIKLFNPTDDFYGQGYVEPLGLSIDAQNASRQFNKALIKNSAIPASWVEVDISTIDMNPGQIADLQRSIQNALEGPMNAGKTFVIPGGSLKQAALSPEQLQMGNSMLMNVRSIAAGMGIASEWLGDAGSKTFSNMAEGRAALYTESAIPLLKHILGGLSRFLSALYQDDDLEIGIDKDEIAALQEDVNARWTRVIAAVGQGVITRDEARAEIGYEPSGNPGADVLMIPSMTVPLEEAAEIPEDPPPADQAPDPFGNSDPAPGKPVSAPAKPGKVAA